MSEIGGGVSYSLIGAGKLAILFKDGLLYLLLCWEKAYLLAVTSQFFLIEE